MSVQTRVGQPKNPALREHAKERRSKVENRVEMRRAGRGMRG